MHFNRYTWDILKSIYNIIINISLAYITKCTKYDMSMTLGTKMRLKCNREHGRNDIREINVHINNSFIDG